MKRQSVTLRELPTGGWLWLERDRYYVSAVTASRSVRREAHKAVASASTAGQKLTVVTIITWEPCSNAGRIAAAMLAKG